MKKLLINTALFSSLGLLFVSCSTMQGLGAMTAAVGAAIDSPILTAVGTSTDSIARASEAITPEQEYYIGRGVAASIADTYKVANKPQVEAYLNSICQTLVINSERPVIFNGYHVAVLDTDEINAFATSGGHIFITKGLLQCTDNEDSLAAVIAHEVAHIQLMHGIGAIKTSRISEAVLVSAGSSLAALTTGDAQAVLNAYDNSINDIITTMVNKGYSKSQEFDADTLALQLMDDAGYDPYAMIDMLNLLNTRLGKSSGGFGSTHPSAKDRLKHVNKELKNYTEKAIVEARTARFSKNMSTL